MKTNHLSEAVLADLCEIPGVRDAVREIQDAENIREMLAALERGWSMVAEFATARREDAAQSLATIDFLRPRTTTVGEREARTQR
jgi:hypothetical protein